MPKAPTVSILMPVRNEEAYLQATLDSLYRQTFADWELTAVDDGSTDRAPLILANAAKMDRRIRIISCRGDGLVKSLKTGP
ncbi:MAG: glycosyltransferase, partial [Desulfuromonadaceae bacterium]|nr:glycosyltransferase [Desulfuromonadaceae bacterium]